MFTLSNKNVVWYYEKISQSNYDIDIKNVTKFLSGQTKEVISS